MKSVEEICDRAALIHQSKKILEGKVADLQQERKKGDYAVRFRGNMIAFVNALWTGFELVDKEILGDDRFIAKLKMRGENSFEDLLRVLIGQVQIEAAWEVLPSMQDIFIEMVTAEKEVTNA
jgi:ABC-2 type transport system ATP-binding protein